jgi:hypothetical protein
VVLVWRTLTISALAMLIGVVATAAGAPLGIGQTGIGGYGLTHVPILQDDAGTGTLYGLRGRFGVLPVLQAEASITIMKGGDEDVRVDGQTITLAAPDMTSFALNGLFKMGGGVPVSTYFTAGVGWTTLRIAGADDTTEPTFNIGAGAELGLGPVSADVGPRLFIINTAGGASRKNIGLLVGVNYYIN